MEISSVKISDDHKLRLSGKHLPSNWLESGTATLFPLEFVLDIYTTPEYRMQAWAAYHNETSGSWKTKIDELIENAELGTGLDQIRLSSVFDCKFSAGKTYINLNLPKELFQLEWLTNHQSVFTHYVANEGVIIWRAEAYRLHMTNY